MFIEMYNQKGEEVGKVKLPAEVFGVEMNHDLVHQAMVAQMANARKAIAHTKDRSEARGGGRKPWRQKGTGRARHGSIRSPIWKGGGVTFGPTKERVFAKKINKKMKRKALFMVLSSKVKDKEMVLLDKLELAEAKTKKMVEVLKNVFGVPSLLGKKPQQAEDSRKFSPKGRTPKKLGGTPGKIPGALIVLSKTDQKIIRAAKNIPKIKTISADSLNVVDILSHKYLLMPQDAIKVIEKTYLK